jgi:mRNA-degrading endonuclease HigB of HigAB toxin-antitoxin module
MMSIRSLDVNHDLHPWPGLTPSLRAGGRTVFNIAGNKYRLVAEINYQKQTIT